MDRSSPSFFAISRAFWPGWFLTSWIILSFVLSEKGERDLAVVAVDGALAAMALRLAAEVPGAVGAVLAQAAAPGPELLALLQRDPQGELQALLDLLEPVVLDLRSSATANGENQISCVDPAKIRS